MPDDVKRVDQRGCASHRCIESLRNAGKREVLQFAQRDVQSTTGDPLDEIDIIEALARQRHDLLWIQTRIPRRAITQPRNVIEWIADERVALTRLLRETSTLPSRSAWIADVTKPSAIRKILRHVRSRAPPESLPASRTPPTGTPSANRKTERSFTRTG